MSRWYLDSSAALKLVMDESESAALQQLLDEERPDLSGCWLLETELRRAVQRNPSLSHEQISDLLGRLNLCEVPPALFREAGLLPGAELRSLDAIHVAAAVSIGVHAVLTYDLRMAESARQVGLSVLAPA